MVQFIRCEHGMYAESFDATGLGLTISLDNLFVAYPVFGLDRLADDIVAVLLAPGLYRKLINSGNWGNFCNRD